MNQFPLKTKLDIGNRLLSHLKKVPDIISMDLNILVSAFWTPTKQSSKLGTIHPTHDLHWYHNYS